MSPWRSGALVVNACSPDFQRNAADVDSEQAVTRYEALTGGSPGLFTPTAIILNAMQLKGRRRAGSSVPLGGCKGASRAGPARHVPRLPPGAPMQPYLPRPRVCVGFMGRVYFAKPLMTSLAWACAPTGSRARYPTLLFAAVGATHQRYSVSAPPEQACGRDSCVSDEAFRNKECNEAA